MINNSTFNPPFLRDKPLPPIVNSTGGHIGSFIVSHMKPVNLIKSAIAVLTCIGADLAISLKQDHKPFEGVTFTALVISFAALSHLLRISPTKAGLKIGKLTLAAIMLNSAAGKTFSHEENSLCPGLLPFSGIISLFHGSVGDPQIEWVNAAGCELVNRVGSALIDGGAIVRANSMQNGGTGGAYLIKNKEGQTLAIFKPEDERLNGPQNPNPKFRKATPSDEDVYFFQMDSFEQGKQALRQHLATLLHVGSLASPPNGLMVKMTSKIFIDIEADPFINMPKVQTKLGYIQEWVDGLKPLIDHHPLMEAINCEGFIDSEVIDELNQNLASHPMIDGLSLDEYQEICINDFLLYNEDRHAGNLLVKFDEHNMPHLIPIDQDAILPSKLRHLLGMYTHPKGREPFTQYSLDLIDSIDPESIEVMVESFNLSSQAPINAKMMAIVLKKFAASGATINDIFLFVSNRDRKDYQQFSELWQLAEKCKTASFESLPANDKSAWMHNEYLRRADWCLTKNEPSWCEPLPVAERVHAAFWVTQYAAQHGERISTQLRANFWLEFHSRLKPNMPPNL